jgi:hypothetical protein
MDKSKIWNMKESKDLSCWKKEIDQDKHLKFNMMMMKMRIINLGECRIICLVQMVGEEMAEVEMIILL